MLVKRLTSTFLQRPLTASATRWSSTSTQAPLAVSRIVKSITQSPKEQLPNNQLVFGRTFTDHMLTVEWDATVGWKEPNIKPYGKICLDPSAVVFHYALECFEGLKAYKDKKGNIRLFRPDLNMKRLISSCERLTLPTFDSAQLLECIKELLRVDQKWIPSERGYSLYLRPTCIATQESLGVGPSNRALLFVIASPVGPYYKTGFNAVSLYATQQYTRAWPGGTGDAKIGANYAPGIKPQIEVAKEGYQQNLWLFGEKQHITEVGTMNFFMYWTNEQGVRELVTPPLDGTILPGVTRDSIMGLARSWNEFKVTEQPISMFDVRKAVQEGRVHEMFGSGTAAIVSPIKKIRFEGEDLDIPLDPSDKTSQAGPLTKRIADTIMGIQYGEIEHPWSVVV
ncbi:branched-chain amino acid aminotransferase [Spizellomyces punctatus DAOM BR117]|uniref:Branched-chain-amino-acid aminotransferase n=1 Tax=Spizellomyces punctatus (strain DAOM BR117) TaxID=645134 RepID=A0A0L0HGI7_SPIPD|nr:branched-chain amino acid aminotransferase [Spizellomyces punctatus DAOM BR117]KNC99948.1 branched-chain amino acid aminotransferase [Spizellomyces punctatus DAOM BR117]|eukprot:XP_016607988.1 branched-chain amino acid aminotransferase [Spizellomyces punctatus DAOM BR117]